MWLNIATFIFDAFWLITVSYAWSEDNAYDKFIWNYLYGLRFAVFILSVVNAILRVLYINNSIVHPYLVPISHNS